MMVRQLHARALEHELVQAATQDQEHTAFGDHYRTRHKNSKKEPQLSFKIICNTMTTFDCTLIKEVLAIKTLTRTVTKQMSS